MYRFSRSIYRELAPLAVEDPDDPTGCASKQRLLDACESTIRRLAFDRRYFARPTRTLFTEVRSEFQLSDQLHAYRVIDRYVKLAIEHIERLPDESVLGGNPPECQAHTRRGTPCQRQPLPGSDYCPSHKHLDVVFETSGEAHAETDLHRGAAETVSAAA